MNPTMSVSPLSMAAAASTSSPPLYKTNLKFPQTQTRFFFFPQKHKSLQSHTCLTLKAPLFFSLSPLHCASSFESQSRLEIDNEENPIEENNNVEENESVKSDDEGRLYVGNLPFSMTSSQVSETFSEAGQVVNVEVVYDRVTDRSRGFAFVTMGSAEEAKEAMRMFDGSQIGGRTVKVNFPEVPRGGERKVLGPKIRESYKAFVDSPHKIYAGNLGWRLTSQGLKDAFADQPGYLSARVVYERDTGRSRGYGFVTFQSADDVQAAMNAMNGVELEGRALRLNYATVRVPSSPSASRSDSESRADSAELITSTST